MSDKAETMECVDCSGRGFRGVLGGLCPTCSGTGVRTTGAVVGAPLVPSVYQTMLDDQENTINQQAAEIERLTGLHTEIHNQEIADYAALTTDRDVLRLEVQRLKDLNFESQDLYAAIEAERDELKAEVERITAGYAGLETEIAKVRVRWQEDRKEKVTLEGELRLSTEDEHAASARAESYLRVIEALRYELAGVVHCHAATIRSIVRLANAGLELPEVELRD